MGEEIQYSRFRQIDYNEYKQQLGAETSILRDWFQDRRFSKIESIGGYELEAWLIDNQGLPSPNNNQFLELANNDLLTPELARFNVELNAEPLALKSNALSQLEHHFIDLWSECQKVAQSCDCNLLAIGILPTLEDKHLTIENMSTLGRYKALNEQVLRQRQGEAINLNIVGVENLTSSHMDVMLEAACTSLQVHLQVSQDTAVRYYNAAQIISAPMVAVSANSPFLFGRDLWDETRIPLFEQSVSVGGIDGASRGPILRVSFGTDYARDSILECFEENESHFPILLPFEFDDDPEQLRHLRLHNGTIWRWNRPLIGFDKDGTPHLRIEHRVIASGPSPIDNIANMALFYGLVHYYATLESPPEFSLDFPRARDNFYQGARHGLNSHVTWIDNQRYKIQKLFLDRLLAEAETGLGKLGLNSDDVHEYLGIIENRVINMQTGSRWQRKYVELNGRDMQQLTRSYLLYQQNNEPVHTWDYFTCDV